MGIVLQFRRPVASPEVVAKLVDLGYLRPTKRHKASVIESAIERLRQDLHRDGVISTGDLSLVAKEKKQETGGTSQAISSPDAS
jgi:hypothetical protein